MPSSLLGDIFCWDQEVGTQSGNSVDAFSNTSSLAEDVFPNIGSSQHEEEINFWTQIIPIFQNLPKFADWPTFPQLYINGEFIGGCDITLELHEKGELKKMIEEATS